MMKSNLVQAIENNNIAGVETALKAQNDLEERLVHGFTPLMLAIGKQNIKIVHLLLDKGAKLDAKNDKGNFPLKLAVLLQDLPITRLLLKYDADPNQKDAKGFTPLMYAAMAGQLALVQLLLEHGSDPTIESTDGKKTALYFSQQKGHQKVSQVLQEFKKGSENPQPASPKAININDFVGQAKAKRALEQAVALAKVNQERQQRGMDSVEVTLHAVFSGSPGTGKTTFARYYAQEIKKIGYFKKGHLIEVSRNDLVAEYVGQTSSKTTQVVKKALGGVLLIDEAYSLKSSKEDHFGQECIDTLIRLLEDHRKELVVILAGYTDEMREFLHLNPGLKSRIPNHIVFEDFTPEELGKILDLMLKKAGLLVSPENRKFALEQIAMQKNSRSFGNARTIRNLIERALAQQSIRLSQQDLKSLSTEDLSTLLYSDLTQDPFDEGDQGEAQKEKGTLTSLDQLMELHALEPIKKEISELADYIKVTRLRKTDPFKGGDLNLHMVFKGNPGTGKTTVARLLGKVFYDLGLLSSGHTIETDRSGLVSGYVGQTALKTKEVLLSALGGVLLIDEAYTLYRGGSGQGSYGMEAIDTLLKFMEDHVGKFMVILAGYPQEMEVFLEANPGLQNRFGKILHFEDYEMGDLLKIGEDMILEWGLKISDLAKEKLKDLLGEKKKKSKTFANARTLRNLLEGAVKAQASRLVAMEQEGPFDREVLFTLEEEDFKKNA